MQLSLPPLSIECLEGDIADQSVDAVVNAANSALWMGSGVAGALKARGGASIEQAAMAQGPIQPGECVVTPAGRLKARFVIHAAVMGQDLTTSAALIESATRASLAAAERHQLTSIAFPALGTGVGGFPVERCAAIMAGAVKAFAPGADALRTVRFVLFGRAAFDRFSAEVRAAIAT